MAPVSSRRLALVLSSRSVEVFSPGLEAGPYHRFEFEADPAPEALAEHAARALEACAERRRQITLFLEEDLLVHQQLRLPPVPQSEVREVLRLQLARDIEDELHFLAEGPVEDASSEDPWRVTAVAVEFHTALLLALRGHGIEVLVTHSLDQALLAASRDELNGSQVQAAVIFGSDRVLVGLQTVQGTHQLAVLPTRSENTPEDVAIRVTQELRGLAAYWRKASRGGELDQWRTWGASPDQCAALEGGALSALGGVEGVHHAESEPREAVLAMALGRSSKDLDLAPGLTPRRRRVGLLSGLITAGLVGLLALNLPSWQSQLKANQERLSEAALEARELERLSAKHAAVDRAREDFEAELRRLGSLGDRGLGLNALLTGCALAFNGRAQLLGVEAGLGDDQRRVLLSAVLPMGRGIDAAALQGLRGDLESLPFLEDVEVELSGQLPTEVHAVPHALEVRATITEVKS